MKKTIYLVAQGEIGGPIPRPLFRAVAEILRTVRQLQREAQGLEQEESDTPQAR